MSRFTAGLLFFAIAALCAAVAWSLWPGPEADITYGARDIAIVWPEETAAAPEPETKETDYGMWSFWLAAGLAVANALAGGYKWVRWLLAR